MGLRESKSITKYEKNINITAAEKVPPRSAPLIFSVDVVLARYLTIRIPDIEHSSPRDANARGRNINDSLGPSWSIRDTLSVDAIAIEAIIEPQ